MARKTLLPGFQRVSGDKAERVRNLNTGEIISDRQYKKLTREASALTPINSQGQKITSNEALAKFNRQTAPIKAASRPARGRKSGQKLSRELQFERAQAAAEEAARKKREAEKRKAENALAQKIERAKKKKIKKRKVTTQGFKVNKKTGERRAAAQYDFESEDELQDLWDEAQGVRGVKYWGVGVRGIDERTGKHLDAWLAGLFDFSYEPGDIDLEELTSDFQERKPYFVFTNWFAHFARAKA